jgi:hypothetical protein
MLAAMALRLLGQGLANAAIVIGGPEAIAEAEAEEKRRIAAEQGDLPKSDPDSTTAS